MSEKYDIGKCLSYIDCQLMRKPAGRIAESAPPQSPAITISRQTGSGAAPIAGKLADYLQSQEAPGECPWTVFDRNLVDRVMEEHHLPRRMAQYLPEDRSSTIQDIMEELLGLHPSSWTMFHQMVETVLHLAEMGHAILIGRGSNVIASRLPNVFHVRLVSSLKNRIQRICQRRSLSWHEAELFVRKEDDGRRRFLKRHFETDIDDPLLYHLVVNTDRMTADEAARLIGEAVRLKFPYFASAQGSMTTTR